MSMTMAEKILSRASGKKEAFAGDYVDARVGLAFAHEWAQYVIEIFEEIGQQKVWDPQRIVILFDHYAPAPTVRSAQLHQHVRSFVRRYGIKYFYDIREGIAHQVLPEKGHIVPGELVVGTDSHTLTCGAFGTAGAGIGHTEMAAVFATGELWFKVPESIRFNLNGKLGAFVTSKDVILYIAGYYGTEIAQYKSTEFHGPLIDEMSIASRMTICNLTAELGAKFAFVTPDQKTIDYVSTRAKKPFVPVTSDQDSSYETVYDIDVSGLEPQVACPHDVDKVEPVTQVEGIKIDQAFLGSCANGRLEDLELAANILKGRRIHEDVRMIVIPASREVYREALNMGLLEVFLSSGAIICNPTCGPCFSAGDGLLAEGEKCISSSNRNFKGRMGSDHSEVYLASPSTVAASAVKGYITDPRRFGGTKYARAGC